MPRRPRGGAARAAARAAARRRPPRGRIRPRARTPPRPAVGARARATPRCSSGSVSSTGTTASAPSGSCAPVMMRTAVPGSSGAGTPAAAATSPATGSVTGASATSAARTAKPSICELRNGGSAIGDSTGDAVMRPSASASATRSVGRAPSPASRERTNAACSSTGMRPAISTAPPSASTRARPGVDPADEVAHPREARAREQPGGVLRADAEMAVHDDGCRGVELADAAAELAERDERGAGDGGDGGLPWFADVEEHRR